MWIAGNHKRTMARPVLATGGQVICRIIDLSESGVVIALSPEVMPAIGTVVTVGKTPGRGEVRNINEGFAIEFTRLQHLDFVEETTTAE